MIKALNMATQNPLRRGRPCAQRADVDALEKDFKAYINRARLPEEPVWPVKELPEIKHARKNNPEFRPLIMCGSLLEVILPHFPTGLATASIIQDSILKALGDDTSSIPKGMTALQLTKAVSGSTASLISQLRWVLMDPDRHACQMRKLSEEDYAKLGVLLDYLQVVPTKKAKKGNAFSSTVKETHMQIVAIDEVHENE